MPARAASVRFCPQPGFPTPGYSDPLEFPSPLSEPPNPPGVCTPFRERWVGRIQCVWVWRENTGRYSRLTAARPVCRLTDRRTSGSERRILGADLLCWPHDTQTAMNRGIAVAWRPSLGGTTSIAKLFLYARRHDMGLSISSCPKFEKMAGLMDVHETVYAGRAGPGGRARGRSAGLRRWPTWQSCAGWPQRWGSGGTVSGQAGPIGGEVPPFGWICGL